MVATFRESRERFNFSQCIRVYTCAQSLLPAPSFSPWKFENGRATVPVVALRNGSPVHVVSSTLETCRVLVHSWALHLLLLLPVPSPSLSPLFRTWLRIRRNFAGSFNGCRIIRTIDPLWINAPHLCNLARIFEAGNFVRDIGLLVD